MTTQERIYLTAKANIGETAWAKYSEREAKRNRNVKFRYSENKCNLFVYEVLLAAGVDIGTPNELNGWKHPILALTNQLLRPPCAIDWFKGEVENFELIGEASKDEDLAYNIDWEQGDILTDGTHMAIVSGDGKTIGAGEKTVNETKFGFDFIYGDSVKIFRYDN